MDRMARKFAAHLLADHLDTGSLVQVRQSILENQSLGRAEPAKEPWLRPAGNKPARAVLPFQPGRWSAVLGENLQPNAVGPKDNLADPQSRLAPRRFRA